MCLHVCLLHLFGGVYSVIYFSQKDVFCICLYVVLEDCLLTLLNDDSSKMYIKISAQTIVMNEQIL